MEIQKVGAQSSPKQGKQRSGIALCLSGGGFRAALFHLGATRRLHELGILPRVDTIAAVSGGSIFAAFLADRIVKSGMAEGMAFQDWEREIAAPFRAFVKRDLRTIPFLVHLLWNWALPRFRVSHLERRYRKRLTELKLGELPEHPDFIFCATDLAFGVNWKFCRDTIGDYQAGYLSSTCDWPLARAVTASSCFPPIFGPMPIRVPHSEFKHGNYQGVDRDKILSQLSLSDGGIYDNMGLEPVWKSHQYILVSDCGAPFEFKTGQNLFSRLLRYTNVVTNQVVALRRRVLFSDINTSRYGGTYWAITSSVENEDSGSTVFSGYSKSLINDVIGNIRTDLDAFTDAEISVLENHGYFTVNKSIQKRVPELIVPNAPGPIPPHPEWTNEAKVREELKNSHKRFSLKRLFAR